MKEMTHRERFLATIERKPVDRPASWLGLPVPKAIAGLCAGFGVDHIDELKRLIDDDVYPIEMPYHSPTSDAIYTALFFAKEGQNDQEERTLTTPGFFEDYTDPQKINDFNWPDPEQYIDDALCKKVAAQIPEGYARLAVLWSCQFQDTCAAFGMEAALMKMLTEPEMFLAVEDKITDFYLRANEKFYQATVGQIDAVLIGNDLGSQCALMISPDHFREFVLPYSKKLIDQAKSYGLKVIHHSCGAIAPIIPDLIEAGVDVIHPIQALATGMQPESLKARFGDRVSFCGGVDAQNLLVHGTAEEIRAKVLELRQLFPTGLVISPSHEAILPDVPPENIKALFEANKSL